MEQIKCRTKGITAISIIIFIFGLLMVGYWTSYIWQGMPLKGIPLGSELVAAVLRDAISRYKEDPLEA